MINNNQNNQQKIQVLNENPIGLHDHKKPNRSFGYIFDALKTVFVDPLFLFLGVSLATNLMLLYYFVFLQTTTFYIFWQSNSAFYNITSIILAVAIAILFGIAMSFVAWQWRQNKGRNLATSGNSFIGAFFGAVSTGCPVCGAFLVSLLGIGGGLAAFPFQGLEIKALSLFLLGYSIVASSKSISSKTCPACETEKEKLFRIDKGNFVFTFKRATLKSLQPLAVGVGVFLLVMSFPLIGEKLNIGFAFQTDSQSNILRNTASIDRSQISSADLFEEVNPSSGYTINAVYGDIGPKLLASGTIDLEKFKRTYERAGQPLTDEQVRILTQESNEKITVNQDNAYFLINFLWALGLANNNPILNEGPLTKYGGLSKIGNFASTGGWTLGTKKATDLYSKSSIIPLNREEQGILEDFANNSYRPCCNNSTAFADCNHGMAALGLGEIMAASGASADEIFEAQKYFNAFWFPQQYLDLAKYFKIREGKDWNEVDARVVMGKDYSTASGWGRTRNWLASNDAIEKVPSRGGGCGV